MGKGTLEVCFWCDQGPTPRQRTWVVVQEPHPWRPGVVLERVYHPKCAPAKGGVLSFSRMEVAREG